MVKVFRKEIWLSFQKDPFMSLELYTLENFSLKNKQNARVLNVLALTELKYDWLPLSGITLL